MLSRFVALLSLVMVVSHPAFAARPSSSEYRLVVYGARTVGDAVRLAEAGISLNAKNDWEPVFPILINGLRVVVSYRCTMAGGRGCGAIIRP